MIGQMMEVSGGTFAITRAGRFMENGGFERHLRHARKELRSRRETLVAGLRRHGGKRVEVVESPAGMHVVAWLNGYGHAQAAALIELAHERGLGLYPIAPHYRHAPARQGLLLGYGGLSTTELREAVRLFGHCLDDIDSRPVQSREGQA